MDGMLDSNEAARRLGVKLRTLYAYVSRGLIDSHLGPDGRHRYFLADDVERLVPRSRSGRFSETRLPTIETSITHITDAGPVYRGVAVSELLDVPFEDVATLLLGAFVDDWSAYPVAAPEGLTLRDRVRLVTALAGSTDPLRSDRTPAAVAHATGRLVATMATCFGPDPGGPADSGLAASLARRLVPDADAGRYVRPINAALVVLADHEASPATLVARVAASTQADVFDAVLAGLGVLSGALYAGGCEVTLVLLERAHKVGVERAIDEELRWRARLPGFGVNVYPDGDPRFDLLRPEVEAVLADDQRETFRSFVRFGERLGLPPPKVELALAGLVWSMEQDPAVGPALFSLARTVGWAAHYLEELDEVPNRFRSRGVYVTRSSEEVEELSGVAHRL